MGDSIRNITRFHTDYPQRLSELLDAPGMLHVIGDLPKDTLPTVGIVGARMCSQYGRSQAFAFARELSKYGVQIISGMAKGIDAAAQDGALEENGKTFAVLGCGVDVCYPRNNAKLYGKIKEQGGIISEYENGTPPLAHHFPMRNRIISGLSDVILVIEAKEKSGSLITVDCALDQGKSVFALPGRVGDELSYGCNQLIAQGAGIAYEPDVILKELNIDTKTVHKNSKMINIKMTPSMKQLISKLEVQPKSLQSIIAETNLSLQEVMGGLLELELLGVVVEPMKNHYAILV